MIDIDEPIASFEEYAKDRIEQCKPTFEKITKIGQDIRNHTNKFDKAFYLGKQDELSILFEAVIEEYLVVKSRHDEAEAVAVLAVKEKHSNDAKQPTVKVVESEVYVEIKMIAMAVKILESWFNITKNYLQTCRSHLSAFSNEPSSEDTKMA